MRKNQLFLWLCIVFTTATALRAEPYSPKLGFTDQSPAFMQIIKDTCKKRVVLLGEESGHGSGGAIVARHILIRHLVEQCGFTGIVFESQFYDFLDLEHAVESNAATTDQLANAIGGLWAKSKDMQPVISTLWKWALAKKVRLMGMDPQLGGAMQIYSQQALPHVLTKSLDGPENETCANELTRHTQWKYTQSEPYDATARSRLRDCANLVMRNAKQKAEPLITQMAQNLVRYLEIQDGGGFNVRDQAMFENLEWHLSRLPPKSKFIVWSANVHIAKALPDNLNGLKSKSLVSKGFGSKDLAQPVQTPLGHWLHAKFGNDFFALAVTAYEGEYSRPGKPSIPLAQAPDGSIEQAIAQSKSSATYLTRDKLRKNGQQLSRAINYDKFQRANWSESFDGILVLPVDWTK